MLPELSARSAYLELSDQIQNYGESGFYSEVSKYGEVELGIEAVVSFLIARPAMLVADKHTGADYITQLLIGEVREVIKANKEEPKENYLSELGDVGFFAIVHRLLNWEEMSPLEQKKLIAVVEWAAKAAEMEGTTLPALVARVAKDKNPVNHRSELYQIVEEESVGLVVLRTPQVIKLGRVLRDKLNGELKGVYDVRLVLAQHWLNTLTSVDVVSVNQIEELFFWLNLDLLEYVEKERGVSN
ncbi:hypothetical protein KBD69_03235 [Candidatus Woesebacteria bacterium]|nr:hypothetical protein [Candidatus Woesebacteria bacterium]